ncbi:hypothetical protein OS493_031499 [Desmophyllum pertusum]|uniref:Uncharacterized protein n=1 Tax=Desmophyllum pertusum TaxID=174260 RepID=A0A9W9ZJP9_9CNID|nr:hypothetical protein OS493_031499 [Desmophyllum pertusum]
MEGMTKTIGDNQGRIGFLESVNKQLEGTVQVKHQQTEELSSMNLTDEEVTACGTSVDRGVTTTVTVITIKVVNYESIQ